MQVNPGERPGNDRAWPSHRPYPEEPMLGSRFRTWPFSARPQSVFANGRRPVCAPQTADTGRYGYLHGSVQICANQRKSSSIGQTPLVYLPTAGRGIRRDLDVARLDDGRESPAAPRAARNLEEGGRGGNGWRQRRPRPFGAGHDVGGCGCGLNSTFVRTSQETLYSAVLAVPPFGGGRNYEC